MQINFSKQEGRVPVTVLHLAGELDASTYTDVIKKVQESYDGGARDLLIDLGNVSYISSAGLMSLHTVALIFAGQSLQSNSSGRPTFRSLDPKRDDAAKQHVKLLNPQQPVEQVLDTVGLKSFFEVFTDLESAVKAF
ncbi:MAG: STAS domain-containing protein [Anaerolineales bacterium]|nr:STAS domain-containing protein [Anaerolineales bacterium]